MRTKVRSPATAQQRAEAVSNFRLLPRLSQVRIDGGGGRGSAGLLGGLHGAERADRRGNVGRVIQFNCSDQVFTRRLRVGSVGGKACLLCGQKTSDISNLRWREAKEFGQEIDLPLNHLCGRLGSERATEPTAGLRAENSRENHW